MKGWSKAMIDGGGGWGCEQGKAGLAAGLGGACSHASSPWKDRAGLRHQQKEIPGCCQLLSSQDNHASCFSLAQEQKSGGGGGAAGGSMQKEVQIPDYNPDQGQSQPVRSLATGAVKVPGQGSEEGE